MKHYRPNHKTRTHTPESRAYWSTSGQGGKQFPPGHCVNLREYWFHLDRLQTEHGPGAHLLLPWQLSEAMCGRTR